ncbi:helix-turn-helix transcriptional regulator [Azohydromonas caseinilytica]|uniref:Helix-turn-helix domain-containing protein n=1 Tax=Azohydromonas caseinilytica TaxID=2728836 RepID=A0A848FB65_9BURK|nr:helix-turn-helix domain-containing protein [Azohydromonas caseinilytica]NML16116.1 helix-turn-helix domain-containing protein [Azohydromonas caseinilytica]
MTAPLLKRRSDSALAAPSAELGACVRAYYWHDLRPCAPLSLEQRQSLIPPNPYMAVVWLVEGRAVLVERGGQAQAVELPAVMLAGAHRQPYRSMALTPYNSFGLVFQPAALGLLSGLDADRLTEQVVDAREHLPPDWSAFLDAVATAPDHAQRIACCEAFLGPRWATAAGPRSVWRRFGAALWQRSTRAAALGLLNWTQRHFQRRTRQLAGLSATEIERLLRLEQALRDVRDGRASRAEAAAAHGYADQPHFTREVRTYMHGSPGELLQRVNDPERESDWLLRL